MLKSLAAPVVWLLKYIVRGMSIIGLSRCASRMPEDEDFEGVEAMGVGDVDDVERFAAAGAPCEATDTRREDERSLDELSDDERLWEAELAGGDAGAF